MKDDDIMFPEMTFKGRKITKYNVQGSKKSYARLNLPEAFHDLIGKTCKIVRISATEFRVIIEEDNPINKSND